MNKKGVTLVELIVSFAIVCVATIYMFRMVTSVKQIYSTVKKETDSYVEEAYNIRMKDACINKLSGQSISSITASCDNISMTPINPINNNNNIYKVSKDSIIFFKYYKPYSPIQIGSYTVEESYQQAAADIFAIARTFIKENEIDKNSTTIQECNGTYSELNEDEKTKGKICKVRDAGNKYNIVVASLNLDNYIESNKIAGIPDEDCNGNGPCSLLYNNRYMTVEIKDDNYCFYLRDQRNGNIPYYRFELCGNTSKVEYVSEPSS